MFFVAIVFVLLPLLVLFVFLLTLAIGVIFVAEHEGVAIHFVQHGAFEHLHRLAFGCVALAGFLVIFPGLKHHLQPRPHLVDRRQLAGRSGLAARALRPPLAALALRTGLARQSRLAELAVWAFSSGMALLSGWNLSPSPGLAILRPHSHPSVRP